MRNLAVLAPRDNPATFPRMQPPRPQRFVPRATLILGGGLLLFFASSLTYALVPVMMGPIPENAAESYIEERVKARLDGKIPWFLGTSMIVAGAIGARLSRPR